MDCLQAPCHHQSVPVETDESMTFSGPDLALLPSCKQCNEHTVTNNWPQVCNYKQARDVDQRRIPEHEPRQAYPAAPQPHFRPPAYLGQRNPPNPVRVGQGGFVPAPERYLNLPQENSLEDNESLEPPLPLMSHNNRPHFIPSQHPGAPMPGPNPMQAGCVRTCLCCAPANAHRPNNNYHQYNQDYPADPRQGPRPRQQSRNPPQTRPACAPGSVSHGVALSRGVMHEVSVGPSAQVGPGAATGEFRKIVSLPEESRNIFITYSVDVAGEMIPFAKFLTDQGFKPEIDIFDDPIQRMDITKWMDRFLNDRSVLIIVAVSPKYKEDVEGHGDDEHGLHTKYIHNRIQNEYIQQGCLNFRLIPVLFPNATKSHVPCWLRSTRIYRWPSDTQDLLLRLYREERYILPQRVADLTLTVRPL